MLTRKQLEELGLEKDAIDKVLDAHSTDIGALKGQLTAAQGEATGFKAELETLKASSGDATTLQTQITQLQADKEAQATAHAAELKQLRGYHRKRVSQMCSEFTKVGLEEYARHKYGGNNRALTNAEEAETLEKFSRKAEKEDAAAQKSNGVWDMFEKHYVKEKLYDINTAGRSAINGRNPYGEQAPFIRIEGHRSAGGGGGVPRMALDENTDLNSQNSTAAFPGEIDLSNNRALTARVLGNNSGDALCVKLRNESFGNYAESDYLIKLDFEGWREFVLAERDNGSLNGYGFPFDRSYMYMYHEYREEQEYDRISGIEILKSGSCDGVRISSVVAKTQESNVVKNPKVQIDGASVAFNAAIGETQYLEYMPGDRTAKLYSKDGSAIDVAVTRSGDFEIPQGDFTAAVSADSAVMPLRATVTFGFTGPEVTG